ncbi:MAG TPA: histidine kinase [Actinoallomurus sp.]|nr:histidine kinase [Actinoallomurus sp.]
MSALYLGSEPPPDDTEERMGKFLELLNCAITQAETRAELIASRARLVDSADAARRRIERDLHDGVQQHLVSLALQMRETEACVPPDQQELRQRLADTVEGLSDTLDELQGIATGLHPPALTRDGLDAALETLVARFPGPVELHIDAEGRLPEELEVAIYYVVSEALTNALKHAYATAVRVDLDQEASTVRLSVRDDGCRRSRHRPGFRPDRSQRPRRSSRRHHPDHQPRRGRHDTPRDDSLPGGLTGRPRRLI